MTDLSLILPCYNESAIIAGSLRAVTEYLDGTGREYEVVVGDDGSDDGTDRIVTEFAARQSRVRLVRSEVNRGKGAILSRALMEGRGGLLAFIDADLEIEVGALGGVIDALEAGADLAIGSKVVHPAWRTRPITRRAGTRGYNMLVRLLLGSRFADHQAGLKGFRREPLRRLLRQFDNPRWTWDTELLVAAQREGLRVAEVPVTTTYQRPSKVSLWRQPLEMAGEILRLYSRGVRVGRSGRDARVRASSS